VRLHIHDINSTLNILTVVWGCMAKVIRRATASPSSLSVAFCHSATVLKENEKKPD
jgi:hypothetical protein